MVKRSEHRWKNGRLSIRIHRDLREALDFIANAQHRPISNLTELVLVDFVRALVRNEFSPDGERLDRKPLTLRHDFQTFGWPGPSDRQ